MLIKIKRKAKILYYKTELEANKHNSKQMWKVLRSAIGKENNKINFPQSFNIENKPVSDKYETANAFNNLFANIGFNVNSNVPLSNKDFRDYMSRHNAQSMF